MPNNYPFRNQLFLNGECIKRFVIRNIYIVEFKIYNRASFDLKKSKNPYSYNNEISTK